MIATGYHAVSPEQSIPASAGIGLRSAHHDQILQSRPAVGWLEAHSENYFAAGGAQIEKLLKVREQYPLSLHGVGLSLGSTDPLNRQHLAKLKRLVDRCQPQLVSEHIAWGSVDNRFLNDLLPLPYTEEALRHLIERVAMVQDYLDRPLLLENISSYVRFNHEHFQEWEFLSELVQATHCGLLVDLNNIYVNACNHGFDARQFIASLPAAAVGELHLAGHSRSRLGDHEILIDTHSTTVCDPVWDLYAFALHCYGDRPTLVEWDAELPELHVLINEARKADAIREACHGIAA